MESRGRVTTVASCHHAVAFCLFIAIAVSLCHPALAQAPLLIGDNGAWNFGSVGFQGQQFYVFAVQKDAYYRIELDPSGSQDLDLYGHWNNSVNQARGTSNHVFSCRNSSVNEHFGFLSNYSGHYFLSVYGAGGASAFQVRVQRFSSPPSVWMVEPNNGGTLWTVGEARTIRWGTSGDFDDFNIQISRNGGSTWDYIVPPQASGGPGVQNQTQYAWTVSGPAGNRIRVRVQGQVYSYAAQGKHGAERYGAPWTNPLDQYNIFPDFEIRSNVTVNRLEISGASTVVGGNTEQYSCTAHFTNGTTQNVTTLASWSENTPYSFVSTTGVLNTQAVPVNTPCRLTATFSGKEDTHDVTITKPDGPTISLNKTTLSPECSQGQSPVSETFEVRNSGIGTLNYSISSNRSWIDAIPSSGTANLETDTITIAYDTRALSAGLHPAVITVTAPGSEPKVINVLLTVAAVTQPVITSNKTTLSASVPEGQNPANQFFEVWNSGAGTLNFTVAVNQGGAWLTVSPGGGTSTGANNRRIFLLTFNAGSLSQGNYTGSIRISDNAASEPNYDIPVNLTVTQPTAPPAPILTYPPNNKVFYPTSDIQPFAWQPVVSTPSVSGYDYYFEKVGGGYGDSHDDLSASTTSWPVNFPPLNVRGEYVWKVRARNGTSNWGPWSETRRVFFRLPENSTTTIKNNVLSYEPVNTFSGAYVYSSEDMTLAGRGLPFEFARFYNSKIDVVTEMGARWRHTYLIDLDEDDEGNVTIHWANLSADYLQPVGDGTYTSRFGGYSGQLTKHPDGTFAFRTKALITYRFDADGRLDRIEDRNVNTIRVAYDGGGRVTQVVDTVGRALEFHYGPDGHLDRVVEPFILPDTTEPRQVAFDHDVDGNLVSVTDRMGATTSFSYAPPESHFLTEIYDRRGNRFVTNVYDDEGRVEQQINGRNELWTYAYTPEGVTTETDPLGGVTTYEYNDSSWIIKQTDANGDFMSYVYDDDGNKTSVTNARGYTTSSSYDGHANLLTVTDALLNVTEFDYNEGDQITSMLDPLGRVTGFEYDERGNLLTIRRPLNHVTSYAYDPLYQLASITDAKGNVTSYTYDAYGNRRFVTNALGQITEYRHDIAGRLTHIIEPNGAEVNLKYDAEDRLTLARDQEGYEVTTQYDPNGNRTRLTNGRGHSTEFTYNVNNLPDEVIDVALPEPHPFEKNEYDALDRLHLLRDRRGNEFKYEHDPVGNLKKTIDALNEETEFFYDKNRNLERILNANGNSTHFRYDELDRVEEVSDDLDNKTVYAYDDVGRLESVTDPEGRVSTYVYDDLDRLVEVHEPESASALYAYDLNGNRIRITDPNGHITTFEYDALDRVIRERDAVGKTTEYTYDEVGNVATRRDGRGNLTRYAYTPRHLLQTVTYPDGSTVAFTYDGNGNRIQMIDGSGTRGETDWTFDLLDRVTEVTDPFGNRVGYGYDANSNRTTIEYDNTAPGTKRVMYGFDANGRLETVTPWAGGVFTYHYDPAGNMAGLYYPNGTKEVRAYDASERLASLRHEMPDGTPFISYSYQYDKSSNIIGMNRDEQAARQYFPELTEYSYNDANEIRTAGVSTYRFDGNGNQTSENTPASGETVFAFDYENRLTRLDPPGVDDLSFEYNGVGDRLGATENGDKQHYLLDLNKSLADVLSDSDDSGDVEKHYIYGINLLAHIDNAEDFSHYHLDHLGSTIALTNDGSDVIASFAYDEFGAVNAATDGNASTHRYGGGFGQRCVDENHLFIRARYLNVHTGRFLSPDPVAASYTFAQRSHYPYVANGPLTRIDPSGLVIRIVGSTQFQSDVTTTLSRLKQSAYGEQIYDFLHNTYLGVVEITEGSSFAFIPASKNGSDWGGIVTVPTDGSGIARQGTDNAQIFGYSPAVALAHELQHALDHATGYLELYRQMDTGGAAPYHEQRAVRAQNQVQWELGEWLLKGNRKAYDGGEVPNYNVNLTDIDQKISQYLWNVERMSHATIEGKSDAPLK